MLNRFLLNDASEVVIIVGDYHSLPELLGHRYPRRKVLFRVPKETDLRLKGDTLEVIGGEVTPAIIVEALRGNSRGHLRRVPFILTPLAILTSTHNRSLRAFIKGNTLA